MINRNKGFTLIELMVTVAIVAILASIAIPSYNESVKKSRRVDAQGALSSLAQAMERYYTEQSTYVNAAVGSTGIFPNEAPLDSGSKFYDLSITTQTSTTFTVKATAKNAQSGDGDLTLTQDGTRGWGSKTCWNC